MCTEYHGRALKVQELWHAKARKLNIPLSAKGHPVGQSEAFTGVAIDSFQGRFSMLPDKMASLVAARQELAASEVSTPRLIARVRGKALHYSKALHWSDMETRGGPSGPSCPAPCTGRSWPAKRRMRTSLSSRMTRVWTAGGP